jgi:5-methylcytosine-specific restriction endonuclease McrA
MAPDRHRSDGCRTVCKECRAGYDRQRHLVNPGVGWAACHRARARKYGLHLTTDRLTRDDVIAQWGERCVYCQIAPFEVIDHVIAVAAGGSHTLLNVVPCCRQCNRVKRWSIDERLIRAFRQGRNGHATQPTSVATVRRMHP